MTMILNPFIRDFVGIFSIEKAAYKELLILAEEKKDIVIKNDIDSLNTIVLRETNVIKKIKALEIKRANAVENIINDKGLDKKYIELDEIIDYAIDIQKAQLIKLKNEFADVVNKLKDINSINKNLMETQLRYTSFCLDVILQNGNTAVNYDNSGSVKQINEEKSSIVDRQV